MSPFSKGWKFGGMVVPHERLGFALVTRHPHRFWSFQITGSAKPSELVNHPASFQVIERRKNHLLVKLLGRPTQAQKRGQTQVIPRIDPSRISKRISKLEFPQVGQSELELLVVKNPSHALARVDELSRRRNDFESWWKLALGYRAAMLRRPIEEAFLSIGIEKIDRMILQNDREWSPELRHFVLGEVAKQRSKKRAFSKLMPSEMNGFERPWWADD
jgi:hypothetical protein